MTYVGAVVAIDGDCNAEAWESGSTALLLPLPADTLYVRSSFCNSSLGGYSMNIYIRAALCFVLFAMPISTNAQTTQPSPGPATQPTGGAAKSKGLIFLSVKGNTPGRMATVTVQATPNSECSITYRTPSGTASKAAGLTSKTTDSDGKVTWTWLIGARTKAGSGKITVICNGESASSDITID
jgi:hypothetical protein